MTANDPLLLRCIALTGSFETGAMPPGCFTRVAGDFDGMGISFSALQWNLGKATLQPLLRRIYAESPDVMTKCFGLLSSKLKSVLSAPTEYQLAWSRQIQISGQLNPEWVECFALLGATPEWLKVAMDSAEHYLDHARVDAIKLSVSSDRALALLFDCSVQNGGVSELAQHHILDDYLKSWGEPEKMRCIAENVARGSNPKWQKDVLTRKLCIANGAGTVHGAKFDLTKFGL